MSTRDKGFSNNARIYYGLLSFTKLLANTMHFHITLIVLDFIFQ